MSVIRVNKTKNYTVMSNFHLKDKNLSLKAKGLLSVMLSLPDDWDYSIAGLVTLCKENKTAVKNALNELKEAGYLEISKLMPSKENGRSRIVYVYDIFESPQETKKQGIENLYLENLHLENQPQLNTNKLNTEKLNTDIKERNLIKKENGKILNNKKLPCTEISDTVDNKKNRALQSKNSFEDAINVIENYTENQELREELKNHLKVRKQKKASLDPSTIKSSLKKLDKISDNDEEKILIVQNAVISGWIGFWSLSNNEKKLVDKKKTKDKPSYDLSKYEDELSKYDDDFTTFSEAEKAHSPELSKYEDEE